MISKHQAVAALYQAAQYYYQIGNEDIAKYIEQTAKELSRELSARWTEYRKTQSSGE